MIKRRLLAPGFLSLTIMLSACGGAEPTPTNNPAPTQTSGMAATGDLAGIKTYLLDKLGSLKTATGNLNTTAGHFYDMAKAVNFDYARLWSEKQAEVTKTVKEGREYWMAASPLYEQVEGIVAGVPSLAEFDVILDAGTSAEEDPEGAVPFDLTLPDGRVLPKPGNLFGVTESTLWGTYPEFTATGAKVDYDGNGTTDFGDALPEANVLKAGAETLDKYTTDLVAAANGWQPTADDAFTALVVMVPTMSEYFNSWKSSRFVSGDASEQRDFVAISRLADIVGILSGLQVVYGEVSPMVQTADAAADKQISTGMEDLKNFVQGVLDQERGGKRFTPEEADLLGEDAQNRATAIAGQVSQVAAQLGITIEE